MMKKQYIKPDLFAKEARVIQLLQGTTEGEAENQPGIGDFDTKSRDGVFFQDEYNSDWNTEWSSIWE